MAAAPPDDQECGFFEATCHLKKGTGDIVSGLAGSAIDQAAESFAKSAVKLYQFLVTFWVNPEVDGMDFGRLFSPRISDNSDDPTYFLAYHTGWLVTWVAVLGLLLAAGRMAWQRRGEPFREAMSGMVTLVVVVFAVTQAVNLALAAGDAYSTWIIDASTSGDVKGNVGKVGATLWGGGAGMGAGLVLIVSLLAILSGVVQLALMLVRGAMLVLLVGALPARRSRLPGTTPPSSACESWPDSTWANPTLSSTSSPHRSLVRSLPSSASRVRTCTRW